MPAELAATFENPSPEDLRKFTEEMPNCRITSFDNVNVSTRVVSRSSGSTYIVTDDPSTTSGQAMMRDEYLRISKIQDDYMRAKGSDYFENSRRATYVQQEYAIRNPMGFKGYGEFAWGITACEGPGPATCKIHGVERQFWDYLARGVPYGPDDGTLAPWAAVTSLPFAPDIVLPTIRHFMAMRQERELLPYGFRATYNPTFNEEGDPHYGWISTHYYGLNQGPIVLTIENYRSEFLWNLMKKCSPLVRGLRQAGFSGGWLHEQE